MAKGACGLDGAVGLYGANEKDRRWLLCLLSIRECVRMNTVRSAEQKRLDSRDRMFILL